ILPHFSDKVVEAQVQRWPTGAPYCFPGRGKLQPTLTRRGGRVFLAGDYLGTLYTETAIGTGLTAAQEVQSLLATPRQRSPPPPLRPPRCPSTDTNTPRYNPRAPTCPHACAAYRPRSQHQSLRTKRSTKAHCADWSTAVSTAASMASSPAGPPGNSPR